MMDTRIGFGYDSHEFKPGVPLRLGGMTLNHPEGLAGHSDVARGHRAQQRIGDGVKQHIAVRVSGEAFAVLDRQSADDERNARLEDVRVKAVADPHTHRFAPSDDPPATVRR